MDKITYIPLKEIIPNKDNPRSAIDKNDLTELAESIKAVGLINPITVRSITKDIMTEAMNEFKYEIVSGERRFKAAGIAGLDKISAIVKDLTDDQMMEIIIIENLQRKEVHPLDEATGFDYLLKTGRYKEEAIGDRIGKPAVYVVKRLKFLGLIEEVKKMFRESKITIGHALEFARLNDKQQEQMLKWLKEVNWRTPPASELKQKIMQTFHLVLKKAPFDTEDDLLLEKLPKKHKYTGVLSCKMCPKRTGYNRNLFDDIQDDVCTDPECFKTKINAHIQKVTLSYADKGKNLIAYSHTDNKPTNGTLTKQSNLVQVKKSDKKCDNTNDLIITKVGPYNYGFDKQVGDIIKACTDPKCKVHKRKSDESYQPRELSEKEKAKIEKERFEHEVEIKSRNKAIMMISDKLKWPLDDTILNELAEYVADDWGMGGEIYEFLEDRGWTVEQIQDFKVEKFLKGKSNLDRLRFIGEMVLRGNPKIAEQLYKKYKIDYAKIKKEVRKEMNQKNKAEDKAADMKLPKAS